jgi:YVTN family beta-propeller protein
VTVPANGKINSTLTVTIPQTVSTNYFTGQINAASGSLSHSAYFTVYVTGAQPPDFQISALPSSLTVNQGSQTQSLITVSSLNGFTGTVHVTVSYDMQHLVVSPTTADEGLSGTGSSASFTLNIATGSNTGTGTYQIVVTGSSGTTFHSVTISVDVVNPSPFNVIATINVGNYPGGVSFDPRNGYVYLTDLFSDTVSVIDGSTNKVVKTIQLPSGSQPGVTAFDSANGNIYVGNLATKTVTVINGTSNTIITTIGVGARPIGIAVDSSNGNLYVVNQSDNTVSVVNATSNSVIKTIIVGTAPAGDVYDSTNKDIYVTNLSSNNVSVINGASNTVVAKVPTGSGPAYLAFDPRNGYVYVTNVGSNDVTVIDGSTNTVATTVSVGMWPSGAAFNPSNGYIYISDLHSNTVSVIDGSTNTVVGTVPVGNGPAGIDYDSANGYVYVANQNDNTVSVISSSSVVTKPDFKITADPSTLTIQPGQTLTTKITVTSLNGFTGAIQVSATYDTQHLAITPTSATMTLGGTGSMSSFLIYVSTAIAQQGQYQIILSASNSNGSITRTTTLTVNVIVSGVAPPTITSVTGVTTNTHSTITIQGTGFGNTPPQTVTLSDGSVDTIESPATPSIALGDSCPSQVCANGGTWEAGHQVLNNQNAIGIYLTSWSDTKIVINRFGNYLSEGTRNTAGTCVVPSGWGVCVGDPITIEVWGPSNSGVAMYTVTATQGTKTPTSLSASCSTTSLQVGMFTTCIATATGDTPTGDITFTTSSSSGSFTPTNGKCTLGGGTCSVTYTDTASSNLTATITASYSGDAYNTVGSTTFALGVVKPSSTSATGTSSVTISNGQATADQTSVTGISVTITGSGSGNGTPVGISTRDLSSLSTGVGTVNLGDAKYYDVLVTGITDGNANICINYASATSSTTMQYWSGSTWTSASNIKVNGGTICGQIPVSALKGTNIAIGTLVQGVSPGPFGGSNLVLIIAGIIVAAMVVVAAVILLRRKGRATLSAQPITG